MSTKSYLNPGNLPKKGVKYFDDTDWNWIVTGATKNREKVWQVLKGEEIASSIAFKVPDRSKSFEDSINQER